MDDKSALVYNAIKDAITDWLDGLPRDAIVQAIKEGTKESIGPVWESQILDAIADGAKEALSDRRR